MILFSDLPRSDTAKTSGPQWSKTINLVKTSLARSLQIVLKQYDRDEKYPLRGRSLGGTSENFAGVLGGFFRSCFLTSQNLRLCGNLQLQYIQGQLLGSLLQSPPNFSEVAPEVRPAVATALLCLSH